MVDLVVDRTYKPEGTFGSVETAGAPPYTVEQPWRNSAKGHSCVPEGVYELVPYLSSKHGDTWCLHNPSLGVYAFDHHMAPPGLEQYECPAELMATAHTYCELHSANFAEQLEGCTAFGLTSTPMFDPITNVVEGAVESSVAAVTQLRNLLKVGSMGNTIAYQVAAGQTSPATGFVFGA